MKMFHSICFAAVLLGCASSASIQSALWEIQSCPSDKRSCINGSDIGLVAFEQDEYTRLEHADEGRYKDLVCYPENFCSMRWLKDGQPLPWAWSEGMGLTQEYCNSTLIFRRAGLEAEGVYTCEVTGANGTVVSRNITLKVEAAPPPPPPIVVAGDLCANHTAELGSDVTFRCEIYVGEKAMASSYAYWTMEYLGEWDFPDYVSEDLEGMAIHEINTRSERPGYLMSELQIVNASRETFVRYQLHASTPSQNSVTDFHLEPASSHLSNDTNGNQQTNHNWNKALASSREEESLRWWKTFGIVVICLLVIVVVLIVLTVVVVSFYKRRLILADMKTPYEYHKQLDNKATVT
ncbi:uncharacterized protein LOC129278930 [Lytechinus pictus]|uniref:uncharacterized protein LOC129278930 n=1 Tax=Lytechinus pictus TaxID=7653 RepID=UPI0030BA2AEB